MRLSRMKTLERDLRKAMDPEMGLAQLMLENEETDFADHQYDPEVLCSSFLSLSNAQPLGEQKEMDEIWSHDAQSQGTPSTPHVQVNSVSTVDFEIEEGELEEQNVTGDIDMDLDKYMLNMQRLIHSHEGDGVRDVAESTESSAWMLSVENIQILLQTRQRMQSQSTGITKQESINVYEYEQDEEEQPIGLPVIRERIYTHSLGQEM